ncbi:TetR/AcrR family transcriptional regulator [Kineococcus rhizosphaerae]|uniref:TetR family transcriptional regulator n=1 Tax=Kineococcus rhizosphaerae TaxID=559628 RepID=A0A2T0QXI7_9ACTN|nr:TetR/AcrR family transcriptional regulator [Kineococcus rhizosphaerae]PRY10751.1 TetR family transcriptional regulator [Kineococcus rhizosphaerae]
MPRTRDVAAQRDLLSTAVWTVLAEDGLPGLTLRAVADRAGCTTGLVLHTFADKRALLRHARELLHARTGARADALERAGSDPLATLRAVLHGALSLTDAGSEEGRVWVGFLAAAVTDPELRAVHVSHNRAFVDRVARLVGRCRPELSAARRTQRAVALVAQVEGLNALASADPQTYSPHRQRTAVDGLLDALR